MPPKVLGGALVKSLRAAVLDNINERIYVMWRDLNACWQGTAEWQSQKSKCDEAIRLYAELSSLVAGMRDLPAMPTDIPLRNKPTDVSVQVLPQEGKPILSGSVAYEGFVSCQGGKQWAGERHK